MTGKRKRWLAGGIGSLALVVLLCWLGVAQPGARTQQIILAELPTEEAELAPVRFSLYFPRHQPLNYTCVLSATPQESYPEPLGEEAPLVQIESEAGQLKALITLPPGVSEREFLYHAEQVGHLRRRQPSGQVHTLRHILLSCEQEQENGEKRIYLLQLELDLAARTADIVPCSIPKRYDELIAQHYQSLAPAPMHGKYSSAEAIPRDMSLLLHATAAIETPQQAEASAGELLSFTWRLARRAPEPHKPWPHNWGEYAEAARSAAEEITRTLIYLQEHDCFGCARLADYINSAAFGAVFGNTFTRLPSERVQESPIEYVTPEHE